MRHDVYAEVKDKRGEIIYTGSYSADFQKGVFGLFQEARPDSFDEYDLEFIEKYLADWENESSHDCFIATIDGTIVGACLFEKVAGPQDQWEITYIYVGKAFRDRGIGKILVGLQENYLKDVARVSFAINPAVLPDNVISYPFWKTIGFQDWGTLPGYFRDDLGGIFLVKRNPYYAIGKGIPPDSAWCIELADSKTGTRISRNNYKNILRSLEPAPKNKWGFGLIGRDNVRCWKNYEV